MLFWYFQHCMWIWIDGNRRNCVCILIISEDHSCISRPFQACWCSCWLVSDCCSHQHTCRQKGSYSWWCKHYQARFCLCRVSSKSSWFKKCLYLCQFKTPGLDPDVQRHRIFWLATKQQWYNWSRCETSWTVYLDIWTISYICGATRRSEQFISLFRSFSCIGSLWVHDTSILFHLFTIWNTTGCNMMH